MLIYKIYEIFDEPTADPSIFPSLAVTSELVITAKSCSTVRSGEIFGVIEDLSRKSTKTILIFLKFFLPKKFENFSIN